MPRVPLLRPLAPVLVAALLWPALPSSPAPGPTPLHGPVHAAVGPGAVEAGGGQTELGLRAPGIGAATLAAQTPPAITEAELGALRPRSIGPAVTGGRITDLAVPPGDPSTIYVATASGGLWKTTNRGHTWTTLFDDQPVSTFGDVAVAPSDPDIVYAGTGEQNNRNSTSWGNGVYRSDDGGATWRHLGLVGTRHVGKIEVHPTDPDVAWVAGLGNLWSGGEERGVFRTTDGGETWEKVLYVDPWTGAVDLALDPSNPDVLYAATYQRVRKAWGFNGGGPGSGIHKTVDGGDTWTRLEVGLPDVPMGRIGLAVAASSPNMVMALVEAPNPPSEDEDEGGAAGGFRGRGGPPDATGTYRSEDGGATWEKMSDENGRPMYYSHVFVHPADPDLVFSASTSSVKSEDGGRTWTDISAEPTYDVGVHLDMHAMWLDPEDRDHFLLAGDGGLYETFDGGGNYRKINNFAIGQFYAIGVDMREPYHVYGGMQDNHSWMGPSETRRWEGILNDDWQQIGFSDGMYQQVDLAGPRYVYSAATSGSYTRVDVISGTKKPIGPEPPDGERYRFDWTSPGLASVHREGLFYLGGNRLFVSRDFGETFERTEELDRGIDLESRAIMDVPYRDVYISRNDGVGGFGVITTLAESPLAVNVLWIGTDDGNLKVSRDQGASWTEVSGNVPGLPEGTYVSRVDASAHELGTAYAAFDAHRDGDFAPYVFRTADFGATWAPLHDGLPEGSVNVVVEHPDNPHVLFLGTEHAPWVSTDGGAHWARIPNAPTTAYDDMVIHPREKDLVMGTHGRSIWILDDTGALAGWTAEAVAAPAHLFAVGTGTLFRYRKDNSYRAQAEFAGENPPDGVELTYRLGDDGGTAGDDGRATGADDGAELEIRRASGEVVRRMIVPSSPGLHRVNWNLKHGDPDEADTWERFDDPDYVRPPRIAGGPFVSPGEYTVALKARGVESTTTVTVVGDPLLELTDADYRATEEFLLRVDALAERVREAVEAEGGGEEAPRFGDAPGPLQSLAREIRFLSRGLGDAGRFYDGNFDPPSTADVERLRELEVEVAAALGG